MKIKKVLLVVTVCALTVLVLPAAATAEPYERPLKGQFYGQVIFTPGDEFGLPPNPEFPFVYSVSSAVGNLTHLGRCEMFAYHPTHATSEDFSGVAVITAANGDQLFTEYDGSGPLPVPGIPSTQELHGEWRILGGSGRFHGASGVVDWEGYVEFPGEIGPGPWPVVWYWSGTISY